MKFMEKVILFFENIFSSKKVKRLGMPEEETTLKKEKNDFVEKLKIEKKKVKIETLTCFGDGLGIQDEMKA